MNYSYVRAVVLPKRFSSKWTELDISNMKVSDIYSNYKGVFLTLTIDGRTAHVDFLQLKNTFALYNNTLAVLLSALSSVALIESPALPNASPDYVKYSDMFRLGYSVSLTKIGITDTSQMLPEDLPDVKVARRGYSTDLSLLHTHCLLSVNGFYHSTDTDGTNAYIVDANKTLPKKINASFGILNFLDIGKVNKYRFTEASIFPETNGLLKDSIGFVSPVDVQNKTVFLVLGGYLVLPQDNVFWQSGDREFRLNISLLPHLERIVESRDFIDLSSLNLTPLETNPKAVNVAEVYSDAVLRKYFALSQSFLVVIDRNNLFWDKVTIRQMMMPGHFISYDEPVYPLFVGHGRTTEYWKVKEDGLWSVTAVDTWLRKYIFLGQSKDTLTNVTDQLDPNRPFYYSQGAMLEIGAY